MPTSRQSGVFHRTEGRKEDGSGGSGGGGGGGGTVKRENITGRDSMHSRETIHSGHFMVSDFEAEAQDDEDELAVPVPEEESGKLAIMAPANFSLEKFLGGNSNDKMTLQQQLSIETSLNKLFQCMSLAYRQKLTSPKWNRFKGIRLRWKDKIRLNNVIWRCWHMQCERLIFF